MEMHGPSMTSVSCWAKEKGNVMLIILMVVMSSLLLDLDDIPKILCGELVPAAQVMVSPSVVEMMIENVLRWVN